MKNKKRQMSEAYFTGALLAVVGGFLDAYTYLLRGGVFANAQTGNIVLLGINLASGDFSRVFYYLLPIAAFAIGVFFCEIIKSTQHSPHSYHWRQFTVLMEILLLAVTAFVPQGNADIIVNTLVSFVCALQVESFRKISGNVMATTMCTGNLRSGTELLFRGITSKDRSLIVRSFKYFGIILFFIFGAFIGVFATELFNIKSILFACVILIIPFVMMFKYRKINDNNK